MNRRASGGCLLLALLLLVGEVGARAGKVDLTPAAWPDGDLEHYTELQNSIFRAHPPASGSSGLVVGTSEALAVRAGVEALRQGGTAVDAVLATALAQTTLSAGAIVSFAGKLTLVYYEASTGERHFLSGGWNVPGAQTSGDDIPPCEVPDGRQVLVPGFMAAVEEAHDRFGRLPFASLFGPAIYFAREGFEVTDLLAAWIGEREEALTRLPAGRQIFLESDGSLYEAGDWLRQKKLAKTLKRVSRRGSRYMYTGAWGRRMVAAVQAEGGRLERADLAEYRALWIEPESFKFAGFELLTPPPPGTGGTRLRRAFEGLGAAALRDTGHYTAAADSLARMLEGVERRHLGPAPAGSHSAGVVVVDAADNVAALLHTINTDLWGGTGIFVDGVSIADVGCWASRGVTEAGPGGRLATGENPAIVLRKRRPVFAASSIGSGLFDVTFFSLVNLMAYGMSPQQAVDTSTFQGSNLDDGGAVVHRVTRGDFAPGLIDAMRDRGFEILDLAPGHGFTGRWIAISIDPESGERQGATTGALNGAAVAE